MRIGDRVLIVVEGTITDVSNAHGLCYEILLAQRDYSKPRRFWLDPDEIQPVKHLSAQEGNGSAVIAEKPSVAPAEREEVAFTDGKCPDCGHPEFWEGPSGGGSVNICCKRCLSAFCLGLPGRLERISNTYFLSAAPKRDFK